MFGRTCGRSSMMFGTSSRTVMSSRCQNFRVVKVIISDNIIATKPTEERTLRKLKLEIGLTFSHLIFWEKVFPTTTWMKGCMNQLFYQKFMKCWKMMTTHWLGWGKPRLQNVDTLKQAKIREHTHTPSATQPCSLFSLRLLSVMLLLKVKEYYWYILYVILFILWYLKSVSAKSIYRVEFIQIEQFFVLQLCMVKRWSRSKCFQQQHGWKKGRKPIRKKMTEAFGCRHDGNQINFLIFDWLMSRRKGAECSPTTTCWISSKTVRLFWKKFKKEECRWSSGLLDFLKDSSAILTKVQEGRRQMMVRIAGSSAGNAWAGCLYGE